MTSTSRLWVGIPLFLELPRTVCG